MAASAFLNQLAKKSKETEYDKKTGAKINGLQDDILKPAKSPKKLPRASEVQTPAKARALPATNLFAGMTELPRAGRLPTAAEAAEKKKRAVAINTDSAPRKVFSTVNPTIVPKVDMTKSTARDEKTRLYLTNDSLLSNDEIFRKYQYVANDTEMDDSTKKKAINKGLAVTGKMRDKNLIASMMGNQESKALIQRVTALQSELSAQLKSTAFGAGFGQAAGLGAYDKAMKKVAEKTGNKKLAEGLAKTEEARKKVQELHPGSYQGGEIAGELTKMGIAYGTVGAAAEKAALKAAGTLGARMSAATASDFAQKAYALAKYNPQIAAAAKFGTRMLGQQAADTAVLAPMVAAEGIAEGKNRDEILKEFAKQEAIAAGFNVGMGAAGPIIKTVVRKAKGAREAAKAAKNAKTTDFVAGPSGIAKGNINEYAQNLEEAEQAAAQMKEEIANYTADRLQNDRGLLMLPKPGEIPDFTAGTRGIVEGGRDSYARQMNGIAGNMEEIAQNRSTPMMLPRPADAAQRAVQTQSNLPLLPRPSETFYAGKDGNVYRSIAEKNLMDDAERIAQARGKGEQYKATDTALTKEAADGMENLFRISGRKRTKEALTLLKRAMEEGQKGKINEELRDLLFHDFYGTTAFSNREMIDSELKKSLKSLKLRISEMDAANIPDFADWRRRTMGKLGSVAKADRSNIDTAYQELSELYPNVFPGSITHPAEQLERIADAADGLVYKKISQMDMMDSATLAEARQEFEAMIDNLETTLQKRRANRIEWKEWKKKKDNPREVYNGRQRLVRDNVLPTAEDAYTPEEMLGIQSGTGYNVYNGRQRLIRENVLPTADQAAGNGEYRLIRPQHGHQRMIQGVQGNVLPTPEQAETLAAKRTAVLAEDMPNSGKDLRGRPIGETSRAADMGNGADAAGIGKNTAKGENFHIEYNEGGAAAATGMKDGKEVTRYTLSHLDKDPTEMDAVKEILNDADFENMDIDTRDFSAALGIKPMGFTFNKDIFRILEEAGSKSKEAAKFLTKNIREPFEKATDGYIKELQAFYRDVYAFSKKVGIKRGSKESAAAQWYREGYRLNKYNEKTPYTLKDLKLDFPEKWQDIVELDKRLQPYLRSIPRRVNENLEAIYPNIESAAWGEWNKYKTAAEKLAESARQEETLIKRLEAEIAAGVEQGKIARKQTQLEKARAKKERLEKTAAAKRKNAKKWEDDIASGAIYENKRLQERANYYPHMRKKDKGFMGLKQIGEVPREIDPRLEGISEFTRPNTKFAGFMQRRKGGYYDADALGNTLDYMPDALYKVYFDPIIANNRKVTKGIAEATKDSRNANGFINALTQWTNELAGKTNPYDRILTFGSGKGRKLLSALNWLNNRAKSNAVMGNVRSAVAQFFNLPNAVIYVKHPLAWGNGAKMLGDSLTNRNGAREIFDSSTFLAQRYGLDKILGKFDDGLLKKPEKLATWMLTAGDEVSTRLIWASAYHDGMRKGITDAVRYADNITRKSVGGRGIGEIPILQNSKIYKFVIPFSLEINNSFNVLKDAVGKGDIAGLGLFMAASYALNSITRENFGFDVSTDFIKAIQDGLAEWDEKEQNYMDTITGIGWKVTGELASAIPSGAILTKVLFRDENEREKIFGENDPSRFGTGQLGLNLITDPIADLRSGKDASSSLLHSGLSILPPFFGRQIERGITGAQDMGILPRVHIDKENGITVETRQDAPGSYTDSGNLRFPMESTAGNMAKMFAFGRYATNEGKEYIENGNKILSEDDTATYNALVKSGVKNTLAYQFIGVIKSKENSEEKRTEIRKTALPKEQQAILYYDLAAGEADKATMDYFKGRGTLASGKKSDMGEVYDVLSRMNEHGNSVVPKRNIIRDSNLDSADKKHIYLTRVVQSDDMAKESKRISAMEKAGISFDDYLSTKNKYGTLYNQKGIGSKQKKAEFDRWLREQGFTREQQRAISEEFVFWGMYRQK